MSKRIRQYIGLLVAIVSYYVVHEGAHLLYALSIGTFKRINFMGLGVQIDVYAEKMSATQLGIFCLFGSVATAVIAYTLVLLTPVICKSSSKLFKACIYYTTIAFLLLDPLYLSALCSFFGGGDMNGIALLFPEMIARIAYGVILLINIALFILVVLPRYQKSFKDN